MAVRWICENRRKLVEQSRRFISSAHRTVRRRAPWRFVRNSSERKSQFSIQREDASEHHTVRGFNSPKIEKLLDEVRLVARNHSPRSVELVLRSFYRLCVEDWGNYLRPKRREKELGLFHTLDIANMDSASSTGISLRRFMARCETFKKWLYLGAPVKC